MAIGINWKIKTLWQSEEENNMIMANLNGVDWLPFRVFQRNTVMVKQAHKKEKKKNFN